jgi:short-subunit dehydrogenase
MNVFITGASSGIGAALARRYAGCGAALGLFGRREGALRAVAASLEMPELSEVYVGDVRDAQAVAHAARQFMARFGTPHVVIANAGLGAYTSAERDEDADLTAAILETNVFGTIHTLRPFIGAMRAAGRGSLVGVASVAAFRGLPQGGAYSASKAAVVRYLESLRLEMRGSGVRVATICPGYVRTPMTAEHHPYRMPFALDADDAALRILRAIDSGRSLAVIPWQMDIAARLLAALPNALYDRILPLWDRFLRRCP